MRLKFYLPITHYFDTWEILLDVLEKSAGPPLFRVSTSLSVLAEAQRVDLTAHTVIAVAQRWIPDSTLSPAALVANTVQITALTLLRLQTTIGTAEPVALLVPQVAV